MNVYVVYKDEKHMYIDDTTRTILHVFSTKEKALNMIDCYYSLKEDDVYYDYEEFTLDSDD